MNKYLDEEILIGTGTKGLYKFNINTAEVSDNFQFIDEFIGLLKFALLTPQKPEFTRANNPKFIEVC